MNAKQRSRRKRMAAFNAEKASEKAYPRKINRAFAKLSGAPLPRVEQALRAPNWREPKEESGGACLPQVAMYSAGHRKSESITAR